MSLKSNFTSAKPLVLVDYTGTLRADVGRILKTLVDTSKLPEGRYEGVLKAHPATQDLAGICARACVVVFWRAAEFAVSDALSAGTPLDQAVQEWETAHQALLGISRKHRQSMVLVDFDRFAAAPADFAAELAAQTGLGFKATKEPAGFHVDPLYRAIAALQVLRALPVTRMDGELEASSVWPAGYEAAAGADSQRAELAILRYQKMLDQEKTAGREQALQQDQIVAVQEELEASHRRMKELEAEVKAEKEAREAAKAAQDREATDRELLTLQLHSVQEELEASHRRMKELEAEVKAEKEAHVKEIEARETLSLQLFTVQEELEASHLKVQQQKADLEKQINAELEAAKAAQAREATDRELLVLQLHSVQEELESYYKTCKTLERDLEEKKSALKKAKSALAEKTRQNDLLSPQLANLRKELAGYDKDLQARTKACEDYESQLKEAYHKNLSQQAELEESRSHY